MNRPLAKTVLGFVILFALYHTAEYFVLFRNSPFFFLLFQAAFFGAAFLIARWQGFSGLGAWGMQTNRGWIRQILTGMVLGILLYGGTFLATVLLGMERIVSIPSAAKMAGPFLLFGFGVFFSSCSEDVLTRGYVFKHFPRKSSSFLFVALSAAIYLGNHIYRLGEGWITLAYLFGLGVLFAIPLHITKRLWFTTGMHWFGNATFFFTHSIIKTETRPGSTDPNLIFICCILVTIPVSIALIRLLHLQATPMDKRKKKLSLLSNTVHSGS